MSRSHSDVSDEDDDVPLSTLLQLPNNRKTKPAPATVGIPSTSNSSNPSTSHASPSTSGTSQNHDIKNEPTDNLHSQYIYKCRICANQFDTRIAFDIHINNDHVPFCDSCHIELEYWEDLPEHLQYCTQLHPTIGRTIVPPRTIQHEIPEINEPIGYEPSTCHKCKIIFKSTKKYKRHICQNRPKWVLKNNTLGLSKF